MNAKTAIKDLRDLLTDLPQTVPEHSRMAIQISMEGLERLEEARAWSPLFGKPLLPSETEY
ncbi:hypothetical protein ES703_59884 [subsurface metagenome]